MTDSAVEHDRHAVAANIAGIASAVNTMDLKKYGSLVTEDFLNMNRDLQDAVTSTVGRQARLDVLKTFFENSPFSTHATMTPIEIDVDGDRAFAKIDGVLKLTPKPGQTLRGFSLSLDLYLFFVRDPDSGWLSERSMGIETARTDD